MYPLWRRPGQIFLQCGNASIGSHQVSKEERAFFVAVKCFEIITRLLSLVAIIKSNTTYNIAEVHEFITGLSSSGLGDCSAISVVTVKDFKLSLYTCPLQSVERYRPVLKLLTPLSANKFLFFRISSK